MRCQPIRIFRHVYALLDCPMTAAVGWLGLVKPEARSLLSGTAAKKRRSRPGQRDAFNSAIYLHTVLHTCSSHNAAFEVRHEDQLDTQYMESSGVHCEYDSTETTFSWRRVTLMYHASGHPAHATFAIEPGCSILTAITRGWPNLAAIEGCLCCGVVSE